MTADLTALDDTVAVTGPDDVTAPAVPGPRHADDIDTPTLPATDEEWDGFVITDDHHLTDMLRALRSIRRRQADVHALIAPHLERLYAEAARLEAWATDRTRPLEESARRIEAAATQYGIAHRTDRRKSFATPYGTVQTRESGGGWEVTDPDEFMKWAKVYLPTVVKTTDSLVKADANRLVTVTPDGEVLVKGAGVLVPGVAVVPKQVKASVSLEDAAVERPPY